MGGGGKKNGMILKMWVIAKKKAAKLPAGLSEQSLSPQKDSPPTPQRGDLSITGIADKPRFILNSKMLLFQIYALLLHIILNIT